MPSYDIRCKECDNHTVRILRISELDDPLEPCEQCGGEVERVILSAPTTIYKGRGWFKTSGGYDKRSKNSVTKEEVDHYERTGKAGF